MTRRLSVLMMLMVALALLAAAPGVDAKGGGATTERKVKLVATVDGKAIRAHGSAKTKVKGTRQQFEAEVEARVADGTTFDIFVTNNGATVKAGSVTMSDGEGELELEKNFPDGVAPVNTITTVSVRDSNGVEIATGTF